MAQFQMVRPFLEEHTALTDLACHHQRPLRTLRRWVQRYRAGGPGWSPTHPGAIGAHVAGSPL